MADYLLFFLLHQKRVLKNFKIFFTCKTILKFHLRFSWKSTISRKNKKFNFLDNISSSHDPWSYHCIWQQTFCTFFLLSLFSQVVLAFLFSFNFEQNFLYHARSTWSFWPKYINKRFSRWLNRIVNVGKVCGKIIKFWLYLFHSFWQKK